MKKILLMGFFAVLLVTIPAIWVTATSSDVFLPGITVDDTAPNGCVDCHTNKGDGQDYRLNISLAKEGHVKIDAMVKTLPNDCMLCHKDGSKAKALSIQVHEAHYGEEDESHFISNYQGSCLQCHSLDTTTWEMSVKSGPKNW
ncbi:MAG: hypothetical protein L3J12_05770 [Spirochaetales bacterium]|nr:hypothetical protein [Spirochaetales bacterium]